jgi:hypothetical protein
MGDGLVNLAILVSTVGVNDNENVPVTWQEPNGPHPRQERKGVFTVTTLFTALEII